MRFHLRAGLRHPRIARTWSLPLSHLSKRRGAPSLQRRARCTRPVLVGSAGVKRRPAEILASRRAAPVVEWQWSASVARDTAQLAGRGGGLEPPIRVQRDQIRFWAPPSASIREAKIGAGKLGSSSLPAALRHRGDVGSLRRRRLRTVILDHALAERAYRGHRGDLLSESWAPTPNILSGRRHLRRPR